MCICVCVCVGGGGGGGGGGVVCVALRSVAKQHTAAVYLHNAI